jgi:hypothetical protein
MAFMNIMSVHIISLCSSIRIKYISCRTNLKATNNETCGTNLQYYYCNQFEQKISLKLVMIKKPLLLSQITFRRLKIGTELDPVGTVSHITPKAVGLYCMFHTLTSLKFFSERNYFTLL